jgi:hypothetical protein
MVKNCKNSKKLESQKKKLETQEKKLETQKKIEEDFRRERNTRWATHTGIPDPDSWYNNGGRMPHELELEVIELKKKYYLLDEIFQLFDNRGAEIRRIIGETPQAKVKSFEDWFDKTLTPGGRVKRSDVAKRAESLSLRKKELFQLLEKRCGEAVKVGDFIFKGWSLVPSFSGEVQVSK